VAFIVNTATATTDSAARDARAGTVALVILGMIATLVGQLTIASAVLRGVLFAIAWGAIATGLLGLVYFIRLGQPGATVELGSARLEAVEGPDPAAGLSITELREEAKRTPKTPSAP
jgi:uncharacterized membrane protein